MKMKGVIAVLMKNLSLARRADEEQIASKSRKADTFWIRCPICQEKTRTKVREETVLINFPLYCPKCRKEVLVNVVQLKMIVCDKQEAEPV